MEKALYVPSIKYKIGVYANVAGLGNTYSDTSVVSSQYVLNSFIQGFNMEDTLCDFVDAGSGRECSDVKIRGKIVLPLIPWVKSYLIRFLALLFEHYFLDVHCQHIIFCGSTDNGYARVPGSHRGSDRISLVEGPPFACELRDLASDFETISFPKVFRSKKMSRKVSFGGITTTPVPTPPRTPTPNYVTIAKRNYLISNDISLAVDSPARTTVTNSLKLVVCKNANDEWVDSALQISTKSRIDYLMQHKYCNQFHILGSCLWGGSCTHKHDLRLVDQDVVDLMWIKHFSKIRNSLKL